MVSIGQIPELNKSTFFKKCTKNLCICKTCTTFAVVTDRGAERLRLYPLNLEQAMLFRE